MRDLPRPIPVSEALRESGIDINVPEGATVVAGPFERGHYEAFRLAEVTSFKDLHLLGFVHPHLSEERLVHAIRQDDRAHRDAIQRSATSSASDCQCEHQAGRGVAPSRRRLFNHHLAELMQPLFKASLAVDDPAVLHTYHHVSAYLAASARFIVGIFRLRDINIADNATLMMTPTVQALHANDVNIGRNGRLRFTSGGVHVKSRTLNGPSLFTDATSAVIAKAVRGLSRERKDGITL